MVTITLRCQHCQSERLVRNAMAPYGRQRYLCRDCGQRSREQPRSNADASEEQEQILRSYDERSSLRELSRTFSVSRNTVTAWLKKVAQLPALSETPVEVANPVLELDELWSFVLRQARKRWIWIALCRQTRQVVAFVVGERSVKTCRRLW